VLSHNTNSYEAGTLNRDGFSGTILEMISHFLLVKRNEQNGTCGDRMSLK